MRSCRLAFGLFWLGFGVVGWVMMKRDAQHLMPDNRVLSALFWIKLIHTLAFLMLNAAIFYILYSDLFNAAGTGLVIAVIVIVTEIVVFAVNGFYCPLTKLARRLGDVTGDDFIADIFLPEGFARLVPLVFGSLAFIGFLLVGMRLLMR